MAATESNGVQRAKNPVPVIVSTNYKGGVGKTCTSRILAQGLVERTDFTQGKPVLVIDMDPQGNTSSRWNLLEIDDDGNAIPIIHPEIGERSSITDLWLQVLGLGEHSYAPVPYETKTPGIHCIPVNEPHMLQVNSNLSSMEKRSELAAYMLEWARSQDVADKYAAIIIDTQPSKAPMIDVALIVGTHCYIPFIPEPYSVEGVYSIISYIANRQMMRLDGTTLDLMGALPNLYIHGIRLHRHNLNALREHPVFAEYIMPLELARRVIYAATDDPDHNPGTVMDLNSDKAQEEAYRFTDYVIKRIQEHKV